MVSTKGEKMKILMALLACMLLVGCSIPLDAVRGMSQKDVESQMGAPKSMMREDGREMWTYKNGECSQFVFFDTTGTVVEVKQFGSCSK